MLENSQTGIVGIEAGRVRFAAPEGTANQINPGAPYSAFANILGIKPDEMIYNSEGDIDLADRLARSGSAPACTGSPDAGLKSGGTLRLDTSAILTAPPLLPFVRKESATP